MPQMGDNNMKKNFDEEIKFIASNDIVSEKLMTLSLYNEFCNSIIASIDERIRAIDVEYVMTSIFRATIFYINLKGDEINAQQFMKDYFSMFKTCNLSMLTQVKNKTELFENDLDLFADKMQYIKVIEQFDSIPLTSKVEIMVQFRKLINDMYCMAIELLGENSSKTLRHNILDVLSNKLEQYLEENLKQDDNIDNISNNLKTMMMTSIKEYLIEKLRDGNFDFNNIEQKEMRDFFANFNELEQKISLMNIIYAIAGYDKNDELQNKEKISEICKYLGISELLYIKTEVTIMLKAKNIVEEMKEQSEMKPVIKQNRKIIN